MSNLIVTGNERDKKNVIWAPHPGSQQRFLSCPVFETLLAGNRGGGKTDALLMDYAQYIGKGYGEAWRGIIFRETYPNLQDVIAKSNKWFRKIFPDATYNESKHVWTFKDGEKLYFRHARTKQDYWNYHGHEYPFVGWEELTNWIDLELYEMMFSVCRSSFKDIPRHYRATCNPFGKGHNAVKHRFIDQAPPEKVIIDEKSGKERVHIKSSYQENKHLLENDPDYITTLNNITDENKRKAWIEGAWDINAGGIYDDVWDRNIHVIKPFDIPESWEIDRIFDWGSSRPFVVGWTAESNGESCLIDGRETHFPAGTVFIINELYGWNGQANKGCKWSARKVGEEIFNTEFNKDWGDRVDAGCADSSIFDKISLRDEAESIHDNLCLGYNGNTEGAYEDQLFIRSDKSPGSIARGVEVTRNYLEASLKIRDGLPMEEKGLFVFDHCVHFIRTVPTLPRSDKNPEVYDSDAEDHWADTLRYRLTMKRAKFERLDSPW